jgi:hypothetical protein
LFELEIRIGEAVAMWLAAQSNGWSSSTRVLGGVGSHHDSTTTMNDHQKQHHPYQADCFPLVWIGNQNWSSFCCRGRKNSFQICSTILGGSPLFPFFHQRCFQAGDMVTVIVIVVVVDVVGGILGISLHIVLLLQEEYSPWTTTTTPHWNGSWKWYHCCCHH